MKIDKKIDNRLESLCNKCAMSMSSTWVVCMHRQKNEFCCEVDLIQDDLNKLENRFGMFSDKEIYVLYRALSEAGFEIMSSGKYTEEEQKIYNELLNELLEMSRGSER